MLHSVACFACMSAIKSVRMPMLDWISLIKCILLSCGTINRPLALRFPVTVPWLSPSFNSCRCSLESLLIYTLYNLCGYKVSKVDCDFRTIILSKNCTHNQVITTLICSTGRESECSRGYFGLKVTLGVYASFSFLFANFFYKAYFQKSNKSASPRKKICYESEGRKQD